MSQETGRPEAPQLSWWNRVWRRFWALPAVIAGVSVGLGFAVPKVDDILGNPLPALFQGGTDGARSLLGTIAGAMISVTGLVFSITIVVLQLASSQFSPRILGRFLENRTTQVTLGVFTGSFLYSLTVLRSVRGGSSPYVPQTAVTLAYVYVVGAVVAFLAFIHYITMSIQVSQTMTRVRDECLRTVLRLHVDSAGVGRSWSPRPGTPRCELPMDDRCGYLTILDSSGLVRRAADRDVVVDLDVSPGDFLVPGQLLGRVWGTDELDEEEARSFVRALQVDGERDLRNDVSFGLRQIVDIAERALSPGVNDPTTAKQAVDELRVLLRLLVARPDPSPYLTDDDDEVRALYRPQTYGAMLAATVTELVHYGRDATGLLERLRAVLQELCDIGRPEHAGATRRALETVDDARRDGRAPTGS